MRHQFGFGLHRFWKTLLKNLGDLSVQLLSLGLEQRLVGRILHQGVLEAASGPGRRAAAEDQLGGASLSSANKSSGSGRLATAASRKKSNSRPMQAAT